MSRFPESFFRQPTHRLSRVMPALTKEIRRPGVQVPNPILLDPTLYTFRSVNLQSRIARRRDIARCVALFFSSLFGSSPTSKVSPSTSSSDIYPLAWLRRPVSLDGMLLPVHLQDFLVLPLSHAVVRKRPITWS